MIKKVDLKFYNKKPAIFIDAFLSDEKRHEVFNRNVTNFVRHGWDVFIISNKIQHFGDFSGVKYFEYDSTNRILANPSRYNLPSAMTWTFSLYASNGDKLLWSGVNPTHGFTNWTLLYNLRRMAEILKQRGYTHFITIEYDNQFKNYNLMDTMFKGFGTTPNSLKCMIVPAHGWKCMTSMYLISVDVVLNTVPLLPTENDYEAFMRTLHGGQPDSPVYEELFRNLFVKYVDDIPTAAHLIPIEAYHETVDGFGAHFSAGDKGLRHSMCYGNVILCPVNNNTDFLIWNRNTYPTMIEYKTNGEHATFKLGPENWTLKKCNTFVEVVTSDMLSSGHVQKYDLINEKFNFTIKSI